MSNFYPIEIVGRGGETQLPSGWNFKVLNIAVLRVNTVPSHTNTKNVKVKIIIKFEQYIVHIYYSSLNNNITSNKYVKK